MKTQTLRNQPARNHEPHGRAEHYHEPHGRTARNHESLYRRYLLAFCIAICATTLVVGKAQGQGSVTENRVGLSASIQGSQFDILVPVWLSGSFSIAPAVGFVWSEGSGTDIRLAVVPRYYFYKKSFAPYLGAKIGLLLASPDSGSSTTDMLVGVALGGEYFFDEHFSMGVESQLNLTVSGDNSVRFGNPGRKNLNTAAAVLATIYF